MDSGWLQVARGGSGAKAPPLGRETSGCSKKKINKKFRMDSG